jgi:hypothetical protein
MPDWEAELRDLLARLDVSYERRASEMEAHLPPDTADEQPNEGFEDGSEIGSDEPDVVRVGAPVFAVDPKDVRRDMEATLARLDKLTRTGQLERDIYDDIVISLHAVMRPLPRTLTPSKRTDWRLTSTSAALRLSRALMRLSFRMAPPIER